MLDVVLIELSVASQVRRNLINVKCADTDMKLAAAGGRSCGNQSELMDDICTIVRLLLDYDLSIVCRRQTFLTQECFKRLISAEHLSPPGIEAALPALPEMG